MMSLFCVMLYQAFSIYYKKESSPNFQIISSSYLRFGVSEE